MTPVDASGTLAGIAALRVRLNLAAEQIAGKGGLVVLATGQKLTHVVSGSLRRSWKMDGPVGGDGVYSARIGPTMIYARRQELGFLPPLQDSLGRSFPTDVGWPYVAPAHLASIQPIRDMAVRAVGEAVSGG
jgi:hypothetical protein